MRDGAVRLGIGAIEVSDNVVPLTDDDRRAIIGTAVESGLEVHGEVGSNSEDSGAETLVAQAQGYFDAGADVVLVERAGLLRGGDPNEALVDGPRSGLHTDRVIFELSGIWVAGTHHTDNYQIEVFVVRTFGPDVHLANVPPSEVWETEALRCGLSVPGPMDWGASG